MSRAALSMLVLASALTGGDALAERPPSAGRPKPAPPASAPAPPSTPAAIPAPTSAVVHVASEIARALGQVPAGALVAASPLVSDVAAPKANDLAVRVATQIAGRIGAAHAHPQPASLATARGASGRAASLVYVQLEIAKGELRATADLYPVVSNAWERLRNPAPGPRAHAFVTAPTDAEVRAFLEPIVLEKASVHKAEHEETNVLAIGCGDVDADGGLEIALATESRVVLAKLRGGKLDVVRAAAWAKLASRAPVPMREPAASVVFPRRSRGELFVGTTDRGALAVDASLVPRRPLTGLPIAGADGDACVSPSPEAGAFEGSAVTCTPPPKGEPAILFGAPAPRVDAIALLELVGKDGALAQVLAAREPSGKLHLRQRDAHGKELEATVDSAGAELALADLDLDGVPEIVSSADGEDDAITISSWRPSGLVQRLKLPAKEGVRAVAACPPEERGLPALVAVVGSEVWLVR